jgi:glutathione S-transferase
VSDLPTLHEFAASGNCYKIRLLLAHLGRPYARREYDITQGATRTPEFLARVGPNGRIPVWEEDGRFLPESNAILWRIAEGTDWLPGDAWERADALRWLFWEQYNHEPNIATLRFWMTYGGGIDARPAWQQAAVGAKRAMGEEALALMEAHLATRDWFVGARPSIADIALYAYTHVAGEAGFDLSGRPAVMAWLARVAALPGHVLLTD